MTIFQVECFLSVAEFLNFAKAAVQMNVSQPAITRQIQSLEEELGTKLFHRSTRVVQLTEDGRMFLTDAHAMALAAHRSIHRFSQKDKDKETIVDFNIGYSSHLQLELLPNVIKELKEQNPSIHPRFHLMSEPHFAEQLEQETIDAAIGFRFPDAKKSLQYRELQKSAFVCICRDDCQLSNLEIVAADDLQPYSIILFDPGYASASLIDGQWALAKGKKPSQLYFCESVESSLLLVHAGIGISLLPDICIPDRPGLQKIPVTEHQLLSFGVYYKTIQGKSYVKEFIKLLKSHLILQEPYKRL